MLSIALALLSALSSQDKSSDALMEEAGRLLDEARKLYESGRAAGDYQVLIDAGFKADEARAKYQAVQQIAQGENRNRAAQAVREANQLIRLVNDARLELKKPSGGAPAGPPAPAPAPPPVPAAPVQPPSEKPAPPPPPPPEKKPPAGPPIDLLKSLDPEKDVLEGKWALRGGKLLLLEKRASDAPLPRVQIPYLPPEEYDLRLTFRHAGNGEVYLILSKGGSPFAFEMGGSGNTVFALRSVREPSGDSSTAVVKKARCLEGTRLYTAVVEVRRDGIKAYLDELLIAYASIREAGDLSLPPALALRDGHFFGIACAHQTVVTAIEIVEVKGRGKALR